MAYHKLVSERKRRICELDAESIAFYRRNPCIAAEELLGIKLIDSQKHILQSSWNKPHVLWCCSRNFGKSFLGAVFMILKAILYENQAIYIVSSVGNQSKETFSKIEEIVLRIGKTAASIRSLKDIVEKETTKSPNNKTGFQHNPESFHVEFYNGSEIFTLNGKPDNNRSRRASLVFFDEAAFSSDELIAVCEAFATQNTEFVTSVDEGFNPDTLKRKCPTQLVYASSQDDMSKMFYRHYKNFAKKMIAGDRDYFVADMICDTAIKTFMNGKPYTALLTQDKVDAAMKANRDKASREYYNQPTRDGGVNQIVKWGTIRRNESFLFPELCYTKGGKYVIAFDPARTKDNSVLGIMKICKNENGYYGEIVNYINLIDLASKKKYKLDSTRQIKEIRETILNYNGNFPDYDNLEMLEIDAGAGGGGVSAYGDNLLLKWFDKSGKEHKGLLDNTYDVYEGYESMYPENSHKLRMLNPRKYKKDMVEEMLEVIDSGLVKFPMEYSGQGYITTYVIDEKTGEEKKVEKELSWEEESALLNIDELKREITSIFRFSNQDNTTVSYALPKDKENSIHDDRFYVFIMLCHYLYGLVHKEFKQENSSDYDYQCLVN